MFDLGWTELLVIGIVALIVVGPKDLPGMFRTIGRFTGKAKAMAREFSKAMNDAADESGVGDISKSLKAAANPQKFGVDKLREAANISPGSETDKLAKKREAERAALAEKHAEPDAAELAEEPEPEMTEEQRVEADLDAGDAVLSRASEERARREADAKAAAADPSETSA